MFSRLIYNSTGVKNLSRRFLWIITHCCAGLVGEHPSGAWKICAYSALG